MGEATNIYFTCLNEASLSERWEFFGAHLRIEDSMKRACESWLWAFTENVVRSASFLGAGGWLPHRSSDLQLLLEQADAELAQRDQEMITMTKFTIVIFIII